MLTRLEIDGFKSFRRFAMDLGPRTVLFGPNGSGKSNLLDAVKLLSLLAAGSVPEALGRMRGLPDELFSQGPAGEPCRVLRLAAEVLLPPTVADPWGGALPVAHSRIRYELELERSPFPAQGPGQGPEPGLGLGLGQVHVRHESARPILARDESWRPGGQAPSEAFAEEYLRYHRRVPFLQTEDHPERGRVFHIHQDRHAPRLRPATRAEATVLSTMTDTIYPHLYALRAALAGWRFLHLDPTRMRVPAPQYQQDRLRPDGANLAAVLARLGAAAPGGEDLPVARIREDLRALAPEVIRLRVEPDPRTRTWWLHIATEAGARCSAQAAADGTLRTLALLTLFRDPSFQGVLCLEEPENGIHPQRLLALLRWLEGRTANPHGETPPAGAAPPAQLLVTSHSPVLLEALRHAPGQAWFVDRHPAGAPERADPDAEPNARLAPTRVRPVVPRAQLGLFPHDAGVVGTAEVERFLVGSADG